MQLAIIRPFPTVLSDSDYNVQEFGLARALAKQGVSVDVYCAGNVAKPEISSLMSEGENTAQVIRMPFRSMWPYNAVFPCLTEMLQRRQYTILQAEGYGQVTSCLIARYAKRIGIPVVLHEGVYEGTNYGLRMGSWLKLFDMTLGRYLRSNIACCVAKTEKSKEFLVNKGFTKIEVLPIGLDVGRFAEQVSVDWREKLGLPTDRKILLYVGRIERRRNVDFLLRVVAELGKRGTHATLLIVGEGPEEDECRVLAGMLNIGEQVFFTGRIAQREMATVFKLADLFLLPSNYEIVGMVLLESLYFSVPIVSTATAGAMDIVGPGMGRLFEGIDIVQWTDYIESYLKDPRAHDFKKRMVADSFHRAWEQVVDRYVDLYTRVIEHHSSRGHAVMSTPKQDRPLC